MTKFWKPLLKKSVVGNTFYIASDHIKKNPLETALEGDSHLNFADSLCTTLLRIKTIIHGRFPPRFILVGN